jgi:hypothetical protein
MFVAAAGGPLWGTYAPPVANVGELVFVAGLLAAAARYGRRDPTGDAGGRKHASRVNAPT